jgi:predicted Zn-dependent protease
MTEPQRAPHWLVRLLVTPWLLVMLCWLGVISLAWNLVAMVLYPLLPEARGRAIGQSGVSWVYRIFWASARLGWRATSPTTRRGR